MKLYFFFLFYFYKLMGWVPMYSYPSIVFNYIAKCTLVSSFFKIAIDVFDILFCKARNVKLV